MGKSVFAESQGAVHNRSRWWVIVKESSMQLPNHTQSETIHMSAHQLTQQYQLQRVPLIAWTVLVNTNYHVRKFWHSLTTHTHTHIYIYMYIYIYIIYFDTLIFEFLFWSSHICQQTATKRCRLCALICFVV